MPTVAERTVIEYLQQARAVEGALAQTLAAHIALTPHGRYRNALERHLTETREHARRVDQRLRELGERRSILTVGAGLAQVLAGQVIATAKAPIDVLRRPRGEEKLLDNARDELVSEALEIAVYTMLEQAAQEAEDGQTQRLAASVLRDEERMSDSLRLEIPTLTRNVIAARDGHPTYQVSETGAADAARSAAGNAEKAAETGAAVAASAAGATRSGAKKTAARTQRTARRTARQARKVPGVARAEGEVKGALAAEEDLAIRNYDRLTAAEIDEQLPKLSQIELAKVDAYERKNKNRTTVLGKIAALRRDEPWPGYDELTVEEIQAVVAQLDDEARAGQIREYERAHKDRAGVLEALERSPATA